MRYEGFDDMDIRLIEIEIFSFCNRKCPWCPNSFISRDENVILPREVYIKLMKELRDMEYKGRITYSRYNEPLSHPNILLDRIKITHDILPDVPIVFNTNGDYLNQSILDKLDIEAMSIMDYDNKGKAWCSQRLQKLGVDITGAEYPYIYGKYNGISILYYVDWQKNALIGSRGDSLNAKMIRRERRTKPCFEPTRFIGIDYNGSIMPCCELRSDIPEHHPYIFGNIKDEALRDILAKEEYAKFRALMRSDKIDSYPPVCRSCVKPPGRYTRDNGGIKYE